MKGFTINGIQQIGVGTVDFRKSWDWYIKTFGFDVKILEDDTVAERMLPYTGYQPQKRHACIAVNLQGGGGLEIWQYSERKPIPVSFPISIGDIGIFATKIKSDNISEMFREMTVKGVKITAIKKDPRSVDCFYVEDIYGNTFQVIERNDVYLNDEKACGGVVGAMVGVVDMDRSISFYRDVLGYDAVLYDVCGKFDDWIQLKGGTEKYRRVLLGRSEDAQGPFSGLLGTNNIELVQSYEHVPKRIFEGRYWGDPGFIQICYDVTGMKALEEFCASKGYHFTVDSFKNGERFDMGEASGHFTYIEDPDGTLIEFVETHKIPIIGKLGLYINIDKRDKHKKLPKILFRLMGLVSRQKR